jgi:GMP synthase-like glutamine amidotransferase
MHNCYNLHQVGINNVGKEYERIALSGKGIQAVQHKEKPIYGVLFHPEVNNKEMIQHFIHNT